MFALDLYEKTGLNSAAGVAILSISIMLISGFLMTRITKRLRLPNVTAYIVAGILIGPFCLDLIPTDIVSGMSFLSDIALAFIAFSAGEFFRLETLKKNGPKVIVITLAEAFLATALVFGLCMYVLRLPFAFSIVLAALAAATAPASTMMTIRQLHARGEYVDTLLQVVALDNIVSLMAYSMAISFAIAGTYGKGISFMDGVKPVITSLIILALGGVFGAITALIMKRRHSTDNRLIIAIMMLFSFCGICALFETSPLLGCMAMSTVYINLTDDERLFRQLNYFNPPILMLFFVRSGVSFDIGALFETSGATGSSTLLVVGVAYFFVRIAGKYLGAFMGASGTGCSREIRDYLGLALIPQAGVAIGLAEMGARSLGGETGKALQTIILASSVLYELIGPACAKASLYLSHSYSNDAEELKGEMVSAEAGAGKSSVERLIRQINEIQKEPAGEAEDPDEKVFAEEADQHYRDLADPPRKQSKKGKKGKNGKGSKSGGKEGKDKSKKGTAKRAKRKRK